MLKYVTTVYAAVQLAILVVEDAGDGVPGAQKKADAIKKVDELLAGAGLKRPVFLSDALLGTLIDVLVAVLNSTGIFRKAA